MDSDPQLKRWYLRYNQRYFGGRLPTDALVGWNPCDGAMAECSVGEDGRFCVLVNPKFNVHHKVWKMGLIHEMVHVAVHPYAMHGRLFQREMLRLANLGAFNKLW